jgi:hypothetical protein
MTKLYGSNSGRVRLPNGRLMSLRSFQETMAEQYPEPPQGDEDDDRIERLETMVSKLGKRLSGIEAMKRLQDDTHSGKIGKPTRPLDAPASAPQFIQEI